MKRVYILVFVLLVIGFARGDASVTREQDPLTLVGLSPVRLLPMYGEPPTHALGWA